MPALYGKIPSMPDFARLRVVGEAAQLLSWTEQANAYGQTRREGWASEFFKFPLVSFLFRCGQAKSRQVFVGGLGPSRDAVGRTFPLLTFAHVGRPLLPATLPAIPIAMPDFFERCGGLWYFTGQGARQPDVERLLAEFSLPTTKYVEGMVGEYERWADATPLASVWSAIFGVDDPMAPISTLADVVDALSVLRDKEFPNTTLVMRLPLGNWGAGAAAFWLDVVRAITRWRDTVPTSFWSSERATLVLALGEPQPSLLADLWLPDIQADHLCDFTQRRSSADAASRLPSSVNECLSNPASRVRHLCAALRG